MDSKNQFTLRYRHIKELPLAVFVEVLCESRLDLLGDSPIDELVKIWQVITEQYNEAIGGTDALAKMQKVVKILLLKSKINRAQILINSISLLPTEYAFKELYGFGYMLPSLQFSDENAARITKVFQGHLKRDIMEAAIMASGMKVEDAPEKPKRADFIKTIVTLVDHFKVKIDIDTITVEMYCAYVVRFNADMEKLIEMNEKNKMK